MTSRGLLMELADFIHAVKFGNSKVHYDNQSCAHVSVCARACVHIL